jgi:hypothetical protein
MTTTPPQYEFHPFANKFRMMTDAEYRDLVADIKAHGEHEPIWLYQGKILDGRNRDKACRELGIKPNYSDFEGDDEQAEAFVYSMNVARRHLDESQRAMHAARSATLRSGQRADQVKGVSIGTAAKTHNVSRRTALRAKKVLDKGSPELVAAVDRGEIKVSAAVAQIEAPTGKDGQAVPIGTAALATNGHDVGPGAESDDPGDGGHDTLASLLDKRVWSGPAEETATLCLARLIGHIIGKCEYLEGFFDKHPELDDDVIKASLNAVFEEGIERLKEAIQHIENGQA